MTMFSIRLTEEEDKALTMYAKVNNVSKAAAMKEVFFEHLEDEYDIQTANKALTEFKKNSKTYSGKEVDRMLGIK